MDEMPVDLVEAVKRGFIQRGLIPRKYHRNSQLSDSKDKSKHSQAHFEKKDEDKDQDGQEVSNKSDEPEPGEVHEKLIDITEKAHDTLFRADTVFPFNLIPHTITLDREKLTLALRSFFRVAKIITVPVTSMINAEADVGPFFGTVRMTSKYFVDNTHEIRYLKRKDATELHRLIQGFIIASEKDLDVSEIEKEDLKVLLHDLGQGVSD